MLDHLLSCKKCKKMKKTSVEKKLEKFLPTKTIEIKLIYIKTINIISLIFIKNDSVESQFIFVKN